MKRHKIIYVLAASHSGSTLAALLIGSHAHACTVGELKMNSLGDLNTYRCSCLSPIRECNFWRDVIGLMQSKEYEFDLSNPGLDFFENGPFWRRKLERPLYRGGALEKLRSGLLSLSRDWKRHIATAQRRNAKFVECILQSTGASAVVDSSKIGSRLSYLLRNPALDVFVVRVVRDGRAVALTYVDPSRFADASDPELRGGGGGGSRENEELDIERAAHEWRRSNEEAERLLLEVSPDRYCSIRYEDLCDNTVGELNRVYETVGLAEISSLPNFRTRNPHVVGNGMRMDKSTSVTVDNRWREYLSDSELNVFRRVAGRMNVSLGYLD